MSVASILAIALALSMVLAAMNALTVAAFSRAWRSWRGRRFAARLAALMVAVRAAGARMAEIDLPTGWKVEGPRSVEPVGSRR